MQAKRRLYRPRTLEAVVAVSRLKAGNSEKKPAASAQISGSVQNGSNDSQQQNSQDDEGPRTPSSSVTTEKRLQYPKKKHVAGRASSPIAEDIPPLPGSHSALSDFTILPSPDKTVFQTFVYRRTESSDDTFSPSRLVTGTKYEWRRRFIRIVAVSPGNERIEVYRTDRRKGEMPHIGELAYSSPLSALQHVHPLYLDQACQLQFESIIDAKRVTQEFVYGHIRMSLVFGSVAKPNAKGKLGGWSSSVPITQLKVLDLCCTSSAERDCWVEYFTTLIGRRERTELLEYNPPPPPVVSIRLRPQDGVQNFLSLFLSKSQSARDEQRSTEQAGVSFMNMDLEPISRAERSVSVLRWDVLVATTVISKKPFAIECARVGILTMLDHGEFAVESVHLDTLHEMYCVRPVSPQDANVLGLYLNDEGMIEMRPVKDGKGFWTWLTQCFGTGDHSRSFHSPRGTSASMRSLETVSNNGDDSHALVSPSKTMNGAAVDGVPFFQSTSLDRRLLTKGGEPKLRRLQSVVIQRNKLVGVARKAISNPDTFPWKDMASLAYVEYHPIGAAAVSQSSFRQCIFAVDSLSRRVYVLEVPPDTTVIMEFPASDVTHITGYSSIFGDSGFVLHLTAVGLEVLVVPLRDEVRRMWNVALRFCWGTEHLLRDQSREDFNRMFLSVATQDPVAHRVLDVCDLCGERKSWTPRCFVSRLPHAEYMEHIRLAREAIGSVVAALPPRNVPRPSSASAVVAKTKAALEKSEALVKALLSQKAAAPRAQP